MEDTKACRYNSPIVKAIQTKANLITGAVALEATLTAMKGAGWTTETLKAIKDLVAAIPTAPALASSWTAALATALGNYTAARAGYLDNLSAGAVALNSTVAKLADVGAIEGAVTLHNKLTAARAGYLDELAAANIPADVDTLLARLTALRAGYLDNLSGGAVALNSTVAKEATLTPVQSAIFDAVYGLSALKNLVDDLESRLTAIRAGYLDNINQAGLLQVTAARAALLDQITALRLAELDAANIPADVDGLKASRDRQRFMLEFWSIPKVDVTITSTAGDAALNDVVVSGIPSGATVLIAHGIIRWNSRIESSGSNNYVNGIQFIQIQKGGAGGYANCITLPSVSLFLAASATRGFGEVEGDLDVVAKVDGDATYNFKWASAQVAGNYYDLRDFQTGLRIWFST